MYLAGRVPGGYSHHARGQQVWSETRQSQLYSYILWRKTGHGKENQRSSMIVIPDNETVWWQHNSPKTEGRNDFLSTTNRLTTHCSVKPAPKMAPTSWRPCCTWPGETQPLLSNNNFFLTEEDIIGLIHKNESPVLKSSVSLEGFLHGMFLFSVGLIYGQMLSVTEKWYPRKNRAQYHVVYFHVFTW